MSVDWDPSAPEVVADQRDAYDRLRSRCPVAHDASGAWTLLRHADVLAAANDPVTFSSRVSRHLNVPNGMDFTLFLPTVDGGQRTDTISGSAASPDTAVKNALEALGAIGTGKIVRCP